jgi:hypothetical protein
MKSVYNLRNETHFTFQLLKLSRRGSHRNTGVTVWGLDTVSGVILRKVS